MDSIDIGRRLRELREAAGLSHAEMADRLGIARPNIYAIEAGRRWSAVIARAGELEHRWRAACGRR